MWSIRTALVVLAALSLTTVTGIAATGSVQINGPDPSPVGPRTTVDESEEADLLVYDDEDLGFYAAVEAAENLGIGYQHTESVGELQTAAQNDAYDTIVVNSQLYVMGSDVLADLAAYAEGPGTLLFQGWELDLANVDDVDDLLRVLGVERPLTTHFSPPAVERTSYPCPSLLLPEPVHEPEETFGPSTDAYIRNAQAVRLAGDVVASTVDTLSDGEIPWIPAQPCYQTAGTTDELQVATSPNGAYVGFLPGNYPDTDTDDDGTPDVVEIYEALLDRYANGTV